MPWPQHRDPPGVGTEGSQRLLQRLVPLPGPTGLDGDIGGGDDVPGAMEDDMEVAPVAEEHVEAQKVPPSPLPEPRVSLLVPPGAHHLVPRLQRALRARERAPAEDPNAHIKVGAQGRGEPL